MVKNLPANAGDPGSIPGLGRSLGEGHGNPFQYSCLGNPMDREAWWATVHGLAKSQVRLSNSTTTNVVLVSGAQQSGSVPLRTTRVPEPERLGPGRCMQPRASLGLFPVEQVAEALRAHASVICLQHHSLPPSPQRN